MLNIWFHNFAKDLVCASTHHYSSDEFAIFFSLVSFISSSSNLFSLCAFFFLLSFLFVWPYFMFIISRRSHCKEQFILFRSSFLLGLFQLNIFFLFHIRYKPYYLFLLLIRFHNVARTIKRCVANLSSWFSSISFREWMSELSFGSFQCVCVR